MKQAILITAYKDFALLNNLVRSFNNHFTIYIHVEKKSRYTKDNLLEHKNNSNVILVEKKYSINWGGFNHVKSVLFLIKEAMKNHENYFFHFITGQDLPVKSMDDFMTFFNYKNGNIYLDSFNFPKKGWADNDGKDRLFYYNFFDILNGKNYKHRIWNNRILKVQKMIQFKRTYSSNFPKIYAGSTYWSMPRKPLKYVLDYSNENKKFYNRFKFTLCAEEFYFQTILINSEYKNSITNDTLRYIDWKYRNGSNPAFLDKTDLNKIKKSNVFFARKFDSEISKELLAEFSIR